MIERWRNNERLLSPHEQPLVTLQRWGDHMNEVEFILRKTSTDPSPASQPPNNHIPQHKQPTPSASLVQTNSNSSLEPRGWIQQTAHALRPSLSASTLPNANSPTVLNNSHNGYSLQNVEDLYSTINKRPPAVPAKPRLLNPLAGPPMPQQPANGAQMNYYHPSNLRPRHPPGYLDYLEAMATRSSLNYNYSGNMYPRTFDHRSYQTNGQLVINRGSAVNVKLHSNSQAPGNLDEELLDTSSQSNTSSVSQIGHDMLKLIEEQKKVLMNQKNELERLDKEEEQRSEEAELINRIETEIRQLEELWKENQVQIKKLENQDFEKELAQLKIEQTKMEVEIEKQRSKLAHCESDIIECKKKIGELEQELDAQLSEASNGTESTKLGSSINTSDESMDNADLKNTHLDMHSNGTIDDSKSSEEDDYEEDSGGDASDDLNTPLRSGKDVVYVDKRGLISGIRSLKLDRSINRQADASHSSEVTSDKTANNNNKCGFLMTL